MKRSALILAILALFPAGLRAQTLELDLNKALEIALNDNPTILIADTEVKRQRYVKNETWGNLLPNVSGVVSYNRAILKTTMDFGGQKISFEPDNVATGGLTVSLPIFAPGVYSTLKLNDEQMRAAVEAARASRVTLVNEVKKAYYNILYGQQALSVLQISENNMSQVVAQTQSRLEQGLASEYEVLIAQVQLSNLKPTIIQTENGIKIAMQFLRMYLALPEEVEITLSGSLEDFRELAVRKGELSHDLSYNIDINYLAFQENILHQQLKVLQTQRMPSIGASGNFQVTGRDRVSLGGASGEGTPLSFDVQTPLSVAVQMTVPIFAGQTRINRERQLRNSINQIQLQQDYAEQGANVQLRNAIYDMQAAEAQMKANQVVAGQALKGYEISKTRFFNGLGTILELNTDELQYTQAKLNYARSILDYLAAEADYRKVLGEEQ